MSLWVQALRTGIAHCIMTTGPPVPRQLMPNKVGQTSTFCRSRPRASKDKNCTLLEKTLFPTHLEGIEVVLLFFDLICGRATIVKWSDCRR